MLNYHEILSAVRGEYVQNPHVQLWGEALTEQQEVFGTPPLTFRGYGKNLKDYRIYGNTIQDGTPTPENPVEVVGCGEYDSELNGYKIPATVSGENLATLIQGSYDPNGEPNVKPNRVKTPLIPVEYGDVFVMTFYKWYFRNVVFFDESKTFIKFGNDFSIVPYIYVDVQNAKYISVILGDTATEAGHSISPNYSLFRLEYKPITTPVYIGIEPLHKIGNYADYVDYKRGVVVRRINKIILRDDGLLNFSKFQKNAAENVWRCDIQFGSVYGRGVFTEISNTIPRKSSHFSPGAFSSMVGGVIGSYDNYLFCPVFSLSTIGATGETDSNIIQEHFLNWLDAQYEAGTPVTVWYALSRTREEPLENLLPIQTIKGTNILTADTTIQPSEMYIKGKIKQIT